MKVLKNYRGISFAFKYRNPLQIATDVATAAGSGSKGRAGRNC